MIEPICQLKFWNILKSTLVSTIPCPSKTWWPSRTSLPGPWSTGGDHLPRDQPALRPPQFQPPEPPEDLLGHLARDDAHVVRQSGDHGLVG
ncbi:hypothetical protein CEXT_532631 [Caerostris extrusa]|uniref:Uncharacterized protein n=1 Tax=Caerostris extrusa TaxID=172846 RepID=A0AAV4QKH3_CAEEX|nr:hypothetical protein CEXT_532631 [Caerostris extrusa]